MLIAVCYQRGCFAEFSTNWIPGSHLDQVLRRNESHDTKTVQAVVRQQFMNGVALISDRTQPQSLCSTLIAATDHEQVLVLAEALVPHLLWCVATFAVTLFPVHAAFGVRNITSRRFWFFEWTKVHVRGDDGAAVRVPL